MRSRPRLRTPMTARLTRLLGCCAAPSAVAALTAFAPYFTHAHTTFWGDALDYSTTGVREWAVQNAELWTRAYGVDGLRLDAVHAIVEPGRSLLLTDLSRVVGHLAATTSRQIHLVVENDDNSASLLDPFADPEGNGYQIV